MVVVVGAAVVVVWNAVVVVVGVVVVGVVVGASVVVSAGVDVKEVATVVSVLLEQPASRSIATSTTAGLTHPLYDTDSALQ